MKADSRIAQCAARAVLLAAFLAVNIVQAEFVLVEDFEGLNLGAIDGQNGWVATNEDSQVVTLPGEGLNRTLRIITTSGVLHKSAMIPHQETRMLFLRFRFEGQHAYSFGMSHLESPSEMDHFGPELRKVSAQDQFEIHNGLNYDRLATLVPTTWYNLWLLVNNDSDNSQVWLHNRNGAAAKPEDQLDFDDQTVFNFRTSANIDLVKFYIKAADGGNGNDPLWIDDIYLESVDGETPNLTNPVAKPSPDLDGDGDVDGDDFLTWQASFGVDAGGDADHDGDTDGDDFLIWQSEFGSTIGAASAAVPEPASMVPALAALVAAVLFARRS